MEVEEEEEENKEENGDDPSNVLPPAKNLHFAPLHLAAAMGDLPAVESTVADTSAADRSATSKRLDERELLLGRRPLHFAVDFVKPGVVRVLIDAGADVKAEDDAGATPLDRVPAAQERHKGDAEKEASLHEIEEMLTMAVLALSLPFVKSLPLHLSIEVVAQVLGKAYELAVTGTGENTACIGFTIVICDARVLPRRDKDGDGVYGEVSKDEWDFAAIMAKSKPIWTVEGFKQLQAAATQDGMIIIDAVHYPGVIAAANFMATTIALGDRIGGGARHRAASAISQAGGGCYVIKGSEDATRLPPPPNAAFHVFCNQPKSQKAPITTELNAVGGGGGHGRNQGGASFVRLWAD